MVTHGRAGIDMGNPYGRQWRRVRAEVLERDGHTCQIRFPGCTTRATQVDHIYPISVHGPTYDPSLLRASCQHCNNARNRTKPPTPPSRRW